MKFKALALVAMLFSASAFAAGGTDYTTDLTQGVDVAGTEVPAAVAVYAISGGAAGDSYSTNVALIEQLSGAGNGNGDEMAVIDQSLGGTGDFAAISQGNGALNGVAYIGQASNDDFAFIKQ